MSLYCCCYSFAAFAETFTNRTYQPQCACLPHKWMYIQREGTLEGVPQNETVYSKTPAQVTGLLYTNADYQTRPQ